MTTLPMPPDHDGPFPIAGKPFSRNPFRFAGSVGRFGENRREDLIKAQILLGNAGYYDLKGLGAPTGWPGGEIVRSIQRLQKNQGLPADGVMLPLSDDGVGASGEGETLAALQEQLGDRLTGYGAPTPEEVDAHYEERARRMAQGETGSAGPVSDIVVAGEDGTAPHPIGVISPLNAYASTALPPPGVTASDIDETAEPQWQNGAQMARGPGIQRPGPRPAPPPGPPRPIPPRQTGPTAAPQQPELRQGPLAPSAGPRLQPLTREQEQQFRNLLRAQERERIDFQKNSLDRHPLREADPPSSRDADPVLPPLRQGRIVIAEDGKQVYVPPLDSWANGLPEERRGTAESINEAVHVILSAEDGSGGSRGSAWTQEGINTLIQSCLKAFDRHPQLAGKMKHVGGGKQDGTGDGEVRIEEFLGNFDRDGKFVQDGSRKLDLTFEYVGLVIERLRGNTVSTKKPGGPLKDGEQTARDGVVQLADGEYMFTVEKWGKGTPKAVMEKIADAVCDGVAQDFAEQIRRKEASLPLDHRRPNEYLGHSKKREAEVERAKGRNRTQIGESVE